MKTIPLSRGLVALIDDCDLEWLSKYCWNAGRPGKGRPCYARTWLQDANGNKKKVSMHRLIMNPPDGMVVDHKNLNQLDNRRENLRICTQAQNLANSPLTSRNKSGFKGVHSNGKGKWFSQFRRKTVGTFNTPEEAALAYKKAALDYWGEFARV